MDQISRRTGLLRSQLEQGLADLVAAGRLTSDSFTGLRALLTPDSRKPGGHSRHRKAAFGIEDAGRWSLLHQDTMAALEQPALASLPAGTGSSSAGGDSALDADQLDRLIMVYLGRWGVLFRRVLERESMAPPWRVLLARLRAMELQGTLRGGRFISGIGGEQFALPATVARLRQFSRSQDAAERSTEYVSVTAADPLNLLAIIEPDLRLPRLGRNRVLYRDGTAVAVMEAGKVRFLRDIPAEQQWQLQQLLMYRDVPSRLRAYTGK